MSASKLSDLLPVEATNSRPNAYEVFGLEPGERDAATLKASVKTVYAELKAAKPTADPEIWKQALRLAEDARKLLEDPERRCALDTSLGIETGRVKSAKTASAPANDPLAALLPQTAPPSNQAAGSAAPTAASSTAASSTPAGGGAASVLGVPPLGSPPTSAAALGTPPLGSPPSSTATVQVVSGAGNASDRGEAAGWAPQTPAKRRKKKSGMGGMVVFGGFVLLMIGSIVGLLMYLQEGGRIALSPDGVKDEDGMVVSEPMEPQDTAPSVKPDGVLDDVPSSGVAETLRGAGGNRNGGSGLADADPMRGGKRPRRNGMKPRNNGMRPGMGPGPELPMNSGAAVAEPPAANPAVTEPPAPEMTPPAPEMTPPMTETPGPDSGPSEEMVQANQKKIAEVETLIRTARWDQMKSEAEAIEALPLDKVQTKRAETLYNIADLALYYRGAIERGLASLKTGNTFEYIEDFPVIVVEVSPESLTIQFNKRSKTYSFDELPPRLMEKIASFVLSPEQPDAVAGLALYRLIHPNTSPEYRADAWEQLESVDGELESVDSKDLQQVAKEILSR